MRGSRHLVLIYVTGLRFQLYIRSYSFLIQCQCVGKSVVLQGLVFFVFAVQQRRLSRSDVDSRRARLEPEPTSSTAYARPRRDGRPSRSRCSDLGSSPTRHLGRRSTVGNGHLRKRFFPTIRRPHACSSGSRHPRCNQPRGSTRTADPAHVRPRHQRPRSSRWRLTRVGCRCVETVRLGCAFPHTTCDGSGVDGDG